MGMITVQYKENPRITFEIDRDEWMGQKEGVRNLFEISGDTGEDIEGLVFQCAEEQK